MAKNRLAAAVVVLAVLTLGVGTASAIPSLQLDIAGGHYVGGTDQTIYSAGDVFTLYALLIPDSSAMLGRTYYLSTALVPATNTGGSFGSYVFDAATIDVTSGMVYGNPPVESNLAHDGQDLSTHDIFPTYFRETPFTFLDGQQTTAYNTQDNPGADFTSGTGMYWIAFTLDLTNLAPGYALHFDLYDEDVRSNGDIDRDDFAPFSHDAQGRRTQQVPEPATVFLLGAGLIGLGLLMRPRRRPRK